MIYAIYPSKDASIYEGTSSLNTGLDSVLEIGHEAALLSSSLYRKTLTRTLVQFDISEVQSNISSGVITSPNFALSLRSAKHRFIPTEFSVGIYAVSGSWSMGTGTFYRKPILSDGVSWKYRGSSDSGVEWVTSSFSSGVTGSWSRNGGGGNYYTSSGYFCTQSYTFNSADILTDVTQIVNKWTGSLITNNGFLLKMSDSDESSNETRGMLSFFAAESNTIYVPRLLVKWDDSSYVTGSTRLVTSDDIVITPKIRKKYKQYEKAKIRLSVRPSYMPYSYVSSSRYMTPHRLPTSSYYQVVDGQTDAVIIPFDSDYTKLSCDATGSYMKLWMDGLQPERFYRLEFKVVTDGGSSVRYFDDGFTFKVSR